MLDIHPAHHAAGSWKEFSIRIATIVLGLLIAISLEQSVEYFHDRCEFAEVRDELGGKRESKRTVLNKRDDQLALGDGGTRKQSDGPGLHAKASWNTG